MGHGSPLVDDLHASRVVMLRDGKAVWGSRVLHCDQSVQQLPRPRAPSGQLQGSLAFVPGRARPLLHVVLVARQAHSVTLLASRLAWLCTWVCDSGQEGSVLPLGPMPAGSASLARAALTSSHTKVMGPLALRNGFTCGVVWQTLHA